MLLDNGTPLPLRFMSVSVHRETLGRFVRDVLHNWVAVKALQVSYYEKEVLLSTIYPCHSNIISLTATSWKGIPASKKCRAENIRLLPSNKIGKLPRKL